MSLAKKITINSLINFFSYFFILVASFLTIPTILANLGKGLFGILLLIGTPITLSSVFDLGIATAAIRYFSLSQTSSDDKSKIWSTSFWLYIPIAIVNATFWSLLSFISLKYLPLFQSLPPNLYQPITTIIFVSILFNLLSIHHQFLAQAKQHFVFYNLRFIFMTIGNTFVTAYVSQYTSDISTILWFQFCTIIFSFISLATYAVSQIGTNSYLPKYDQVLSRKLLSFGLRNSIGKLVGQIDAQLSRYTIGLLGSPIIVTVFAIPQQIINKFAGMVSQFSMVIFPLSASMVSKTHFNKLKQIVISSQLFFLFMALASLVVTKYLGQPALSWWLKDDAMAQLIFPVLQIMVGYFALTIMTPIPSVIMDSLNLPQIPSLFASLTVAIEFGLFFVLVPQFGAIGAAQSLFYSSLITVPTFLLVFFYKLYRYRPHD